MSKFNQSQKGIGTVFQLQCIFQVVHIRLTIEQSDWVILVIDLNYFSRILRLVDIWQGSPEENPSVLIGSSLVMVLPCGRFPWKRS